MSYIYGHPWQHTPLCQAGLPHGGGKVKIKVRINKKRHIKKKQTLGTGELAQQLGVHIAPAKDPSSVPSTSIGGSQPPVTMTPG